MERDEGGCVSSETALSDCEIFISAPDSIIGAYTIFISAHYFFSGALVAFISDHSSFSIAHDEFLQVAALVPAHTTILSQHLDLGSDVISLNRSG